MCGIVGLISRRSNGFYGNDLDMMENLLVLDTLRGLDSTGAFCISGSKKIMALKHATFPHHLFRTDEWRKFRNQAVSTGKIIIGHNRKATQGSISSENAHPFIEKNIVLVHNGTLRGHKELADKDVDSHAVCHAFAERGAEATLPTIDGAFAFVWWDTKKERLYAVRNDERPLYLVVTETAYAIASEAWMPTVLFSRSSQKVTDTIPIEPGELYEFSLDGKFTVSKVKLKEKVVHPAACATGGCGDDDQDWNEWRQSFVSREHTAEHGVVPFRRAPVSQQQIIEEVRAKVEQTPVLLTHNRGFPSNDPNFKSGERVCVEFDRFNMGATDGRIKAMGKVIEEGKPEYDVVCFLPPDVDIGQTEDWAQVPVMATVTRILQSNCGPSMWVKDPSVEEEIKTNNHTVSRSEWRRICTESSCSSCGGQIHFDEAEFTTVTKHFGGRYRITCADCVADKLPEGEIKDEFIKRRNAALQTGKPVSAALVSSSNGEAGPSSTTTLH